RVALAAGASFVARTSDNDMNHMKEVLTRAANHKGSAFVEILQNCVIFNDNLMYLHPGDLMLYGTTTERAFIFNNKGRLESVDAASAPADKVAVHDESDGDLAYLLSSLEHPSSPVPVGVFRAVAQPTYNEL